MKVAALFPGQGSQSVGMAKELYDSSDIAASYFEKANKVLGYSLSKLCFEGPIEELTLTKNTQPALLVASYVSYLVAKESCKLSFSATAGHSLGEYTALVLAESLDFSDAIYLVHKRGTYMQEAVGVNEGAMAAILGLNVTEITQSIKEQETGIAEIANLNSPAQTVVAGDVAGIEELSQILKSKGAKVIPLNVSAPFHCSLMKPAAERLQKDLDTISFKNPKIPVYANVTSEAIHDANEIKTLLEQQVCSTVRWTECMEHMISEHNITHTIEFGPGGVLTKLLKRIHKGLTMMQVHNSDTVAALDKSLE